MLRTIGIIGAMDVEIASITKYMKIHQIEKFASLTFYQGCFQDIPCVVVKCGPGKVNAAICTQVMIDRYELELIINTGVAGGIGKNVHIGDIVIASSCVEYDVDTTALGDALGFISGINLVEIPCNEVISTILEENAKKIYGQAHKGVIATGDSFVADKDKSQKLGEIFNALACEMEGAAIVHTCYMNGVEVAVIRAISDNANDSGKIDYSEFTQLAAENCVKLLKYTINKL